MAAARNGHLVVVQAMLDAGVSDPEARYGDGAAAFLVACCQGDVECVEALSNAWCDNDARNRRWDRQDCNLQMHRATVPWSTGFAAISASARPWRS